jgi:oligoribonuclease NrnB/cAMP/cGMP phosphodiesterase (DHH superfamily)
MSQTGLLLITHANCLDGFTAGQIYSRYLRKTGGLEPAVYSWNPNGPLEVDLAKYAHVVFIDCFPTYEVAKEWTEIDKFSVIDHHKSTADTLRRLAQEVPFWCQTGAYSGVVDLNRCASQLVCKELGITEPWWVKHVADKDLWLWANPNSKEITRALGSEYPFDLMMHESQEINEPKLIAAGKVLMEQDRLELETLFARSYRILVSMENEWHRGQLVRLPEGFQSWGILSELGERMAEDVGIALLLQQNGTLSCRSKRGRPSALDCDKFCRQLGGGGHFNAAGAKFPVLLSGDDTEFTKPVHNPERQVN